MQKWLAVGLAVALVWPAAACVADHSSDIEAIGQEVKALPGVSDTHLEHSESVGLGNSMKLGVTLDASVTDEQAGDVGRTFAAHFDGEELGDPVVDFTVHYPPSESVASFHFQAGHNLPPKGTADLDQRLEAWMRMVKSPTVQSVSMYQTESGSTKHELSVTVQMRPGTPDDARELQRDHPVLAQGNWCIKPGYCPPA
ncbi:hypothetical protein [Mycobacterium sp. NPDC050441]|uniref:hypothetical protein n=1 Tax=Mycobacterium sp. NPDC050441 TaxID=3155403 RepID=UPI0033DFA36C